MTIDNTIENQRDKAEQKIILVKVRTPNDCIFARGPNYHIMKTVPNGIQEIESVWIRKWTMNYNDGDDLYTVGVERGLENHSISLGESLARYVQKTYATYRAKKLSRQITGSKNFVDDTVKTYRTMDDVCTAYYPEWQR
jgi:hypothetical protein